MADFQYAVLVTTTTTSDQEIVSFTASSSLELRLMFFGCGYTTYSGTEAYLGFGKIQYDYALGSSWETIDRSPPFINTDLDNNCPLVIRPLGTGHPVMSSEKIRAICTPASATSMRWKAGFWFA